MEIHTYNSKVIADLQRPNDELVAKTYQMIEKAILDTAQQFSPENTTYSSIAIFAKEYIGQLHQQSTNGSDGDG